MESSKPYATGYRERIQRFLGIWENRRKEGSDSAIVMGAGTLRASDLHALLSEKAPRMDERELNRVKEIFETAKRDDWHLQLVGSDVRELCRIILRLSKPSAIATSEWIPVAEGQLPRDAHGDEVLVWTITGHCLLSTPTRIRALHADARSNAEDCFYTHWRETPKGPQ